MNSGLFIFHQLSKNAPLLILYSVLIGGLTNCFVQSTDLAPNALIYTAAARLHRVAPPEKISNIS